MTKQIEAPKAQTAGAAQTAQNGNNANSATPKKPETVGEVVAKTLADEEKTRKALEKRKQELEKCLSEIERKKELVEHLDKFHKTDHDLETLTQLVDDEIESDEFESNLYRIRLVGVNTYGDKNDIASISNVELIKEFIVMLRAKIAEKVTELETELMK